MYFRRVCLLILCLALGACGAPTPQRTASDVIAAFQAAGLEAESRALTQDDYGAAPYLCADGAQRLLIPSLGADTGGRVFQCADPADATRLKAYYDALGESSALFASYTYQRDGTLVQLTSDLDEATAKQYEAALMQMP
jgi:hypothetical protein